MAREKTFIAIAGNIGTGKTTLTRLLSERLGWIPYFEAIHGNPYLADFYRDMRRWSFPLQVFFLTHRFQAHQKIVQSQNSAVQDRSIYEDAHVFARNLYEQGNMEERDYRNYLCLYDIMCHEIEPPELIIYLKKSLPCLKNRIQLRGREFEQAIPDEYLLSLNSYYDEWMENYAFGKKLIIPSDHLDFIENRKDLEELIGQILEALDQKDLFLKPSV